MDTEHLKKYLKNKTKYFKTYKPIKFIRVLDEKYPYRVARREHHYYKCFSTYYKPPRVPITVTWSTKEKPLTLSYD